VAAALAFAYVLNDVTPESLPWNNHVETIIKERSAPQEIEGTNQDKTGLETQVVDR
jgi:hypothetical protein